MVSFATTTVDLTSVPFPNALELLDSEVLISEFVGRFKEQWDLERVKNPTLPEYDVETLEFDPVIIVGQAWAYLRLLDRQRVNDGIKSLFAFSALHADLDHLVASRNIQRILIREESEGVPALYENDAQLLNRYLLKADYPSAGSAGRMLYDAYTTFPELQHGRVNGFDVHGRRGDTDVVLVGPDGRDLTDDEMGLIKSAVKHVNRAPEAASVSVMHANRVLYQANMTIYVADIGPDPDVLLAEAKAAVETAQVLRLYAGAQVPEGYLASAAFSDKTNIIRVVDNAPVTIEPDVYSVPVGEEPIIDVEVINT